MLIEFQFNSFSVNERTGEVRFTIVKRNQTSQPVTVQFTTQDGSATGKQTYTVLTTGIQYMTCKIYEANKLMV